MSNILTNLARHGAEIYGADREVFARIDLDRPGGAGTEPTTWGDFSADVDAVAYALETIGIEPGDMVAVFAPNCPEILLTDFACFRNRAVPVAIYATSSPEQVRFILNDSARGFTAWTMFIIIVSGIVVFVPIYKKYIRDSNGKS